MGDTRSASAPTFWRIVLGRRLTDLRERAGKSYEEAAREIGASSITIRRMEKAEVGLRRPSVRMLLEFYGVPAAEAGEFMTLVDQANEPGWWYKYRDVVPTWFSPYVALEDVATLIRPYEPHYVPGLLQTEDYARAVLSAGRHRTADELERRVTVRMKRQGRLHQEEDAPTLWALLEESVLLRPVGGPGVMRAQLQQVLDASRQPNVTVQILPLGLGAHPGTCGPFTVLRFKVRELPDGVYVEDLASGEIRDRHDDVAMYLETLDHMAVQAATITESRQMLEEAIKKA
ncbi:MULTISPECIES: helix-turn-helix domain-containing protein [Streptomyces]|uniref:helix-turn-helix domain-containing protein n=1 Tax=Streptomyces TaxID=1883 RepID=UPI0004CD3EE6|nr:MULTISPECIES: helix-turn-helix transcriptional regulator [Streptomyces]